MMQADIWSINPDGTGATPLTAGEPEVETNPVWSYDGQRIAFTRPAPDQEVFVMDANGGGATNLTNNGIVDQGPSFFPDGRIAYMSVNGPGMTFEILVMNGDGSGQHNITNNSVQDLAPAVSPDGTKIAFEHFDGTDFEIYVMNPDGSDPHPLTANASPLADDAPTWSPDGRRIAWHRTDGVNVDVWVMNADGSDQHPLVATADTETFPAFAPDNSRLLFTQGSGGGSNVAALGLIPPAPVSPITTTGRDSEPDWQPIPVNCGGRRATIVGTPSADSLTGTPGPDVISGQGGKDKITGLAGKDRLCGDQGKDKLKGGPGKDKLIGGKGKDNCAGGKGKDTGKSCERGKI
jgi:TolB protein